MFAFRMMLLKLRYLPPVRALLNAPDRLDDGILRGVERLMAWGKPRWNRVEAWARQHAGRLAVAALPLTRGAGRGWTLLGRGLERVPLSCGLGLMATLALVVPARIETLRINAICAISGILPGQLAILPAGSVDSLVHALQFLSRILVFLIPAAALAAFVRHRLAHLALKAAAAAFFLFTLFLWRWATAVPGLLSEASPELFPNSVRNELWVFGGWRSLPWLLVGAVWIVILARRPVTVFYGGAGGEGKPGWADRLWTNLKTHGGDPGFRKALYTSGFIHFFLIFVAPFLFSSVGCNELPYGIPYGSGTPVIEVIKVKKVKKKPEKKYVLNMNTAISFYVPKIDDSEVLEEVDKETENEYEAQQVAGKLGAGGGKEGGWPNGMKNTRVRFIRLEYDGGDWNQDMGIGADYNMLLKFRDKTGFEIATETESRPIAQLKRFPKNRAPPFVYLTGGLRGGINISQSEVKVLRSYCLDMGGMLFADNGGGNFDSQFRAVMKRTFPDLRLVEIAKDDVLFQQPFSFPAGAPPLWHHSGNNAMGIKYKGRWVVFYHQGDINDAWKTGHSGASPGVAEQAYKLGINVINYAFNQYMYINFGGTVPK